ncbi:MAG: hypothetical protein ACREC6_04085 [Hyphomicrobiaceae bacterium]
METIERLAKFSVARGCGFALLAISTLMVGLSGEFALALRTGGTLCLMMCFVLMLFGWRAPQRPYKRTEVWLLLKPAERPDAAVAQRIVGNVLREVYLNFALRSACLAAGMLVMAVLWGFIPGKTPL